MFEGELTARKAAGLILASIVIGGWFGLCLASPPKCEIIRLVDIWASGSVFTTITIENTGGNGYVTVQYITYNETLATKEYWMPAQSIQKFEEVLLLPRPLNITDRQVIAGIIEQISIPIKAIKAAWSFLTWSPLIVASLILSLAIIAATGMITNAWKTHRE